jgi:molybdopterin-guanine dinucleotide biosynthesis protein A
MVLLTGGASARFGAPKHIQAHPEGGTWSSYLVDLFQGAFDNGPVRILGEAVPGRPDLAPIDDPREGPARALARWAAAEGENSVRWWVVACDQVRWDASTLAGWHGSAQEADPEGRAWVLAQVEGEMQPLGGFLGGRLLHQLGRSTEQRLIALARSLPHRILSRAASPFLDLDDPGSHKTWLLERRALGGD